MEACSIKLGVMNDAINGPAAHKKIPLNALFSLNVNQNWERGKKGRGKEEKEGRGEEGEGRKGHLGSQLFLT